jgi:hypothetical protein
VILQALQASGDRRATARQAILELCPPTRSA